MELKLHVPFYKLEYLHFAQKELYALIWFAMKLFRIKVTNLFIYKEQLA